MTNFNFEYKGTFLRYKDSNGNLLDLNGSQVDTDLDERTEQNETDIAALQQYFDSISVKKDASGGVASFADGADGIPVKSLVVNIEPIQEGTGDPSPENVRPISGRTVVNIWRDAEHDTTADPTITIQLGQTVYGGTVDVTTGEMVVDRAIVDLGTLNWDQSGTVFYSVSSPLFGANGTAKVSDSARSICEIYQYGAVPLSNPTPYRFYVTNTPILPILRVSDDRFSSAADFKTAMSEIMAVFELATPIIVQLTAQQLTTVLGQNNVWSDGGDVSVDYVADTKLYIDSAIAANADSAESVNANNREEVKETINEIEKPDVIEEKEVKEDDNIEEEKEI